VNPWADLPSAVRWPLSFGLPLVLALLVTPLAGRLAHRIGVVDRPSAAGHKTHDEDTPYLGGLALGAGLVVVSAGFIVVGAISSGANAELFNVLAGAALMAMVGLLDDLRGVSPPLKLGFEAFAAVALWQVGVGAGIFDSTALDVALTVLWVVAVTNAVNFIDNMDGLAAGVTALSALGIFAISAGNGDLLVSSLALALAGASLGFLRYNFPPARIFLGDAGSLMLGFLLAALILKLDLPVGPAAPRVLATVLLAAVPLFDLSVVVLARTIDRRPLWLGARDHTSHRLVERGVSRRAVAVTFMVAQGACAAAAYPLYRLSAAAAVVCLGALALAWGVLLRWFLRRPAPVGAEPV
jgi:UDP-GlcNAc:undecaprenyl-phosphate/decaprenyl-phosphate GlcNAc-1-phosphate transferase